MSGQNKCETLPIHSRNWLLSYDSLYIHMWLHKVSMCICFVCSWKWVYLLPICSSTLFSILIISIHFLRNVLVMLWVVTWAISYATPSGVGELNSFALVGFVIYVGFVAVNNFITVLWRVYIMFIHFVNNSIFFNKNLIIDCSILCCWVNRICCIWLLPSWKHIEHL